MWQACRTRAEAKSALPGLAYPSYTTATLSFRELALGIAELPRVQDRGQFHLGALQVGLPWCGPDCRDVDRLRQRVLPRWQLDDLAARCLKLLLLLQETG